MPATVRIRRMRPGDEPQAEALWKGMSPYRPGDESAVEAMYARADRARATGDKRWKGLDAPATDEVVQDLSASWVAAVPSDRGEDRVVGTVQVVGPTALSRRLSVARRPTTVRAMTRNPRRTRFPPPRTQTTRCLKSGNPVLAVQHH